MKSTRSNETNYLRRIANYKLAIRMPVYLRRRKFRFLNDFTQQNLVNINYIHVEFVAET